MKTAPYIDIHTHGANEATSKAICVRNVFAANYPEMVSENYVSVGLHPWHIKKATLKQDLENLNAAAQQNNVIAIGETGLDRAITVSLDLQKTIFESHLIIAAKANKPVIIHAVRAYPDIVEVYKKTRLDTTLIFHGFNGNTQTAKQLTGKGFYLSFGENLFKDKSNASAVFRDIPLEHIFLETDESKKSIVEIYARAAELKKMASENLKGQIHQNFINCFGVL